MKTEESKGRQSSVLGIVPKVGDTIRGYNDDTGEDFGPVVLTKTYKRHLSLWWVGVGTFRNGTEYECRFTEECIIEINGKEVSYV